MPPEASPAASAESEARLQKLCAASPLYAQWLQQRPQWREWLLRPENQQEFRYQALVDEWRLFNQQRDSAPGSSVGDPDSSEERLREWRRLISLRVAFLAVNELISEAVLVAEMSRLAEFCIQQCTAWALAHWAQRYGDPWDDLGDRPARFGVMALGKLGGQELNFSSDVDLVFLYEGDGYCRRAGELTPFAAVEAFTKVAETIVQTLSRATAAGFLFRVDVRLRPEGAAGLLVRSLSAMEHYYAVAGQTWERLAWIKARPIAGDVVLGAELLESLQDFRYPRHPSVSLLAEIAAVKRRTEREVVGAALERDVKSGTGGIREIEFVAQANQVLHAGRFPFLQTHQTQIALQQLARYGLLAPQEADELAGAYWFLRRVEHRLQMREEQSIHALPAAGATLEAVARTLNSSSVAAFEEQLREVRRIVRKHYDALLAEQRAIDDEFEAWWTFFSSARIPSVVEERLRCWMKDDPRGATEVRLFAGSESGRLLTREQVQRFRDLAPSLDAIMPQLAQPAVVLRWQARLSERYGARSHFFSICASQPTFLGALALLFDRSGAIHELLCAHPEIFEEVIRPENLRQEKNAGALDREFSGGPSDAGAFARWFALYVRAEQVRIVLSELLEFVSREAAQRSLLALADAAWRAVIRRHPAIAPVIVLALGKYGSGDFTPGSDLDLMFLVDEKDLAKTAGEAVSPLTLAVVESALRDALRLFQQTEVDGPVWEIDARLRPHGESGPLLVSWRAAERYYQKSAQLWERQALTRARVVAGPADAQARWGACAEKIIYAPGLTAAQRKEIWRMRLRVQNERDVTAPPERAFKTAAGGAVDHEFLVQAWALEFGAADAAWRSSRPDQLLRLAAARGLISEQTAERLIENYNFIKNEEWVLRRDANRPLTVLPEDLKPLANWLGFVSAEAFWAEHVARMRETRSAVESLFFPASGSK